MFRFKTHGFLLLFIYTVLFFLRVDALKGRLNESMRLNDSLSASGEETSLDKSLHSSLTCGHGHLFLFVNSSTKFISRH